MKVTALMSALLSSNCLYVVGKIYRQYAWYVNRICICISFGLPNDKSATDEYFVAVNDVTNRKPGIFDDF